MQVSDLNVDSRHENDFRFTKSVKFILNLLISGQFFKLKTMKSIKLNCHFFLIIYLEADEATFELEILVFLCCSST
jgi:hypothetical protein